MPVFIIVICIIDIIFVIIIINIYIIIIIIMCLTKWWTKKNMRIDHQYPLAREYKFWNCLFLGIINM